MKEKIEINVTGGVKTLEILEGQALPKREQLKLNISGIIDTPVRFLKKRVDTIEQKQCHVLVDRNKMTIALNLDETNYFKGSVIGSLEIHPDFEKWEVNTGQQWTNKALSEFIKMNRSSFSDIQTAMKLSSELQSLKIKADKEIDRENDNRGNVKEMIVQRVIQMNIPQSFKIHVPIFKGQPKAELEIEIYVNPNTFNVTLISPEAMDVVSKVRDTAIDEQLKEVEATCPDMVIIEQ